jgi:outer membrane protein OmpA-like peptidoglycan-associated protein
MRTIALPLSLLLCLTFGARAQVSVDMHALDGPGGGSAPVAVPRAAPAPVPARAPNVGRAQTTSHAQPVAPAAASTAVVTPAIPLVALPTAQPAMPPASTTVATPAATPSPFPPTVRLMFGTGQSELSPGDEATIRDLARSMPAPSVNSVDVVAYAAGRQDDPSTARRLSLSRGMAVRSVLLESGVPSSQIYVRALGSAVPDGPPDRVELTVTPIGTVTR